MLIFEANFVYKKVSQASLRQVASLQIVSWGKFSTTFSRHDHEASDHTVCVSLTGLSSMLTYSVINLVPQAAEKDPYASLRSIASLQRTLSMLSSSISRAPRLWIFLSSLQPVFSATC
jgi:hypothetical protein